MRYCSRCILPDSRPNLSIGAEGICNACKSHAFRTRIDWKARKRAFARVVKRAKAGGRGYDCLVPVSGGKDSHWQVVTCLEHGLRVLAVTWRPHTRTGIGTANLDNLRRLGVDHVDYSIDPAVEKKFALAAFRRFGSTAVPMHMALFNIPLKLAALMGIPLVVWGENSAFEYGGTREESMGFALDDRWLRKYGMTHGTRACDWVGRGLSRKDLAPYFGPNGRELAARGVRAVFLGYYFPWDPRMTFAVARKHGFRADARGPRTGTYDFADIDDDIISVNHHVKWYKFGFTRSWDNLSLEIRNGRMSRERAIEALRKRGDETPRRDIRRFCSFAGISEREFFRVCERFRDKRIWKRRNGKWVIPDFLIPSWRWT